MASIKDLLAKRANVWSQMTAITDTAIAEGRALTGEENETYTRAETELDALTATIEKIDNQEERGKEFNAPPVSGDDTPTFRDAKGEDHEERYAKAFRSYLSGRPLSEMANEYRQALQQGWREDRAQGTGTTAGGYLVPPGYRANLVETYKYYGPMLQVAEIFNTDGGQDVAWPTVNDTSNVGAILAENTQMAEQDVAFGTATLSAYMYYSKLTRISYQLLQDASFDVEGKIQGWHGARIGRILNTHWTTGTGSSQPQGIITGATTGVTAAGTTAVTSDELISLQHSLDIAYRGANSRWMFGDALLQAVRKLKDSTGQYIWQPGLQAGMTDRLLGSSYIINPDFPAMTTGNTAALYGDFNAGYVIRLATDVRMLTLNERFADYLQVAHASYQRAGGAVQNANAYKAIKLA